MYEIRTEIEIGAPAECVWSILVDFPRHPDWNPFIRSIEGRPERGGSLRVFVQPPGGRGMTFRPTVLESKPGRELRWKGRLVVPGLFDGEHYFVIEPVGNDRVRFVHGEKFSGIFVPFAKPMLKGGTAAGFQTMNAALKARAESMARGVGFHPQRHTF